MCVLFFLLNSPVYPKMHCIIYMFMSTFLLAHLTKITVTLCRKISHKKSFSHQTFTVLHEGYDTHKSCVRDL